MKCEHCGKGMSWEAVKEGHSEYVRVRRGEVRRERMGLAGVRMRGVQGEGVEGDEGVAGEGGGVRSATGVGGGGGGGGAVGGGGAPGGGVVASEGTEDSVVEPGAVPSDAREARQAPDVHNGIGGSLLNCPHKGVVKREAYGMMLCVRCFKETLKDGVEA